MSYLAFKELVELVESLAVIGAAVVAIWIGLNWKRDFLGKRRLELQEDVLTKMHELKGLLSHLQGSLRYVEHQNPVPEVGELTLALRFAAEDAVKAHHLVLAKLQEIAALEIKARFLFEPHVLDAFRVFTVARVLEFTKIHQTMGHISMLESLLEKHEEFDERRVEVAEGIGERVSKLLTFTDERPHSFDILGEEIDKFCSRLAMFRPASRGILERLRLKRIFRRLQK